MKKILFIFMVAVMAASCLNSGSFETTYHIIADFEYNEEVYETHFGKDSVYVGEVQENNQEGGFMVYDLIFANKLVKAGDKTELLGGFAMSYAKDSTLVQGQVVPSQYSVYSRTAAYKTKTFAVFYDSVNPSTMPTHDIKFVYPDMGSYTLREVMIANTTEVVSAIKYGIEGVMDPFADGDYLKIVATAIRAGKTVTAEFYLADYRGKQELVTGWKKWDLSSLGEADYLDFSIESSKAAVPKRFCLDYLIGTVKLSQ